MCPKIRKLVLRPLYGGVGTKWVPAHTNFKLMVLSDYWELSAQIWHAFRSG